MEKTKWTVIAALTLLANVSFADEWDGGYGFRANPPGYEVLPNPRLDELIPSPDDYRYQLPREPEYSYSLPYFPEPQPQPRYYLPYEPYPPIYSLPVQPVPGPILIPYRGHFQMRYRVRWR